MWVRLPPRRGARPASRVRVPAAHPLRPTGPSAMPSPSNKQLSNMRLKLAGLSLLSESEWLCPNGHELSFNDPARGGRVARSLSASR